MKKNKVVELQDRAGLADYLTEIPGSFFRLGCGTDVKNAVSLHNPTFSPDERALINGAAILTGIILKYDE